jgi:hypothetical protein
MLNAYFLPASLHTLEITTPLFVPMPAGPHVSTFLFGQADSSIWAPVTRDCGMPLATTIWHLITVSRMDSLLGTHSQLTNSNTDRLPSFPSVGIYCHYPDDRAQPSDWTRDLRPDLRHVLFRVIIGQFQELGLFGEVCFWGAELGFTCRTPQCLFSFCAALRLSSSRCQPLKLLVRSPIQLAR